MFAPFADRPLAALTGGTGFLGRHAARALHEAGWRVRLLVRRDPVHPLLAGIPIEVVQGGLDDAASLDRLVHGAVVVVHAAGLVKAAGRAAFMAANAAGSAALAGAAAREAARRAPGTVPPPRLVLVSSQAAREPGLSDYAASKRAGEDAAIAAAGPCPWVVVRPPVIYGPWDEASLALLRLGRQRAAPGPRDPEPRLALVHVRDAAAAIVALCRPDAPHGRCFELRDDRAGGYGWRELLAMLAAAQGRAAPRALPLPDAALRAAGWLADGWTRLRGRPSLFGIGKAREILHRDWRPDPGAALPPGLAEPAVRAEEGLRSLAEWAAKGGFQ